MSRLADELLGSSTPPTDPRKMVALHQALVAALAAAPAPVPAGELYAVTMAHDYSLEDFEAAVGLQVRAGVVKREGDLLSWVGPR